MLETSRSFIVTATVILALSALPAALNSQEHKKTNVTAKHWCYRGEPMPHCEKFVLTELIVDQLIVGENATVHLPALGNVPGSSYVSRPDRQRLTGEVGLMINQELNNAYGATALVRTVQGPTFGAKFRYRRWLTSDGRAIDVGVGATLTHDEATGSRAVTPLLDVAYNFRDYAGISAGVDTRMIGNQLRPSTYAGAKLGSVPALGGTALLGIGFVVILAAILHNGD